MIFKPVSSFVSLKAATSGDSPSFKNPPIESQVPFLGFLALLTIKTDPFFTDHEVPLRDPRFGPDEDFADEGFDVYAGIFFSHWFLLLE